MICNNLTQVENMGFPQNSHQSLAKRGASDIKNIPINEKIKYWFPFEMFLD